MPMVFTTKSAINQGLLPFLAAFHKAIPFQTADHITNKMNPVKNQGFSINAINFSSCCACVIKFLAAIIDIISGNAECHRNI